MVASEVRVAARADHGTTILAVEDEVLVRMVLAEHLRVCGHRVLEASNGADAVQVLSAKHPVDLLLTDIGLADGIDGFEFARRGRRWRPELKIILTSGAPRSAHGASDLRHDHSYFDKSYELDAVVGEARRLLDAGAP
jgi:CheY-like chemotaxis protein